MVVKMNKNRLLHGLLPALLLNLSIGSVYAFTSLSAALMESMTYSKAEIQFAFSLAIFFLGTSAAFFGNLVERNTKKSSIVSCLTFTAGLLIAALGVKQNSLLILYLGYGVVMGIGLGTGYLTPVKSLMQWYPNNKGLSTGLAVTFFGLAATVAAPLIKGLLSVTTASGTLLWMGIIYFIPTFLSFLLIKKPSGVKVNEKTARKKVAFRYKKFTYMGIIKEAHFIPIWIIFFISIHCGLAVIPLASDVFSNYAISAAVITMLISMTGLFNGAGRLLFSAISDHLQRRIRIYVAIFVLAIAGCFLILTGVKFLVAAGVMAIVSAYGAGFSCLPSNLSEYLRSEG
jgi:OFA family oxalate/formate antiporter-like MFS transporter